MFSQPRFCLVTTSDLEHIGVVARYLTLHHPIVMFFLVLFILCQAIPDAIAKLSGELE